MNQDMPSSSVYEGVAYSEYRLVAVDEDSIHTEMLSYELMNAPAWLTVNVVTGELSGTPSALDIGFNKEIELRVVDSQGAMDHIVFDVEVMNVNDRPTVEGLELRMKEDGELIITTNVIEGLYGDEDEGR